MTSFISSFVENIHEKIDPSYLKEKEKLKQQLQPIGLISTAILVASVAISIIGIALTASGGLSATIGLSLILVSLPLGYLSFNVYKVSKNIRDIIDKPKEYQKIICIDSRVDKQKMRDKLKQDTFWFDWAVDNALNEIFKSNNL